MFFVLSIENTSLISTMERGQHQGMRGRREKAAYINVMQKLFATERIAWFPTAVNYLMSTQFCKFPHVPQWINKKCIFSTCKNQQESTKHTY